jgi:hypothetical protein
MLSKDKVERGEILGSLERRIKAERSMLHHRLTPREETDERPVVARRKRTNGRLYQVFQALVFGDGD